MFLKIGNIIINSDYIAYCIVDEQIERICITMKSGFLFLFGCIAETYGVGKQKVKEVTYLTSEEYNSLKCYLKGDFCRNVA